VNYQLLHTVFLSLIICFLFDYRPVCAQNNTTDSLLYYSKLSDSLLHSGDYAQNLKYCLRIKEIAEKNCNCHQIADSKRKVGIAYDFLLKRNDALKWLHASFETATACSDDSTSWRALRYIGGMYFGLGEMDSSRYYLHASLERMLKSDFYDEIASNYGMLGELYGRLLGHKEKAREFYLLSLDYAKRSKDLSAQGFAHLRYASHLVKNGDCDGKNHSDTAYTFFEKSKDMEGILYALNSLAFCSINCGKPDDIYHFLVSKETLKDSLFSKQISSEAARYSELFETKQKELEISSLQYKNQNKNYILIALIILLVAAITISLLLFNRRKIVMEKKRIEELQSLQLSRFRDVIEAEEKERTRIARELHDSLGYLLSAGKMNLSNIEITIQADSEQGLKKVMGIIDEASKEVRAISHNLMPSTLTELGLHSAIKQLIKKIENAGISSIDFSYEITSRLDSEKEINIYRIVQELINNCLKHARASKIILHLIEKAPLSIFSTKTMVSVCNLKVQRSTTVLAGKIYIHELK
jgi:tetratricopeptide (TPR) repeat protein